MIGGLLGFKRLVICMCLFRRRQIRSKEDVHLRGTAAAQLQGPTGSVDETADITRRSGLQVVPCGESMCADSAASAREIKARRARLIPHSNPPSSTGPGTLLPGCGYATGSSSHPAHPSNRCQTQRTPALSSPCKRRVTAPG